MLSGIAGERHEAAGRRQPQHLGEHKNEQRAEHEHRDRKQHRRHRRHDAVEAAAAMHRRIDAGRHADEERQQGRGEDQLERARQPQRDLGCDRIVVDQRAAEIEPHQAGREIAVLRQDRPVEAEARAQLGDRGRIGHRAAARQQQFGRIARHQMQHEEDDRCDQPREEQRPRQAAREEDHPAILVSASMNPEDSVSAPGRLAKPSTCFFMPKACARQARPTSGTSSSAAR